MSTINCNYCRKDGHYIKSRTGQLTCPVLLAKNKRNSNQYKPRNSRSEDGWSQVGRPRVMAAQPKSQGFVKCASTFSVLEEEVVEEKTAVQEGAEEEKMPDLQGCWGNANKSSILKPGNNLVPAKLSAELVAIKEEHSLSELEIEKQDIEDDIVAWNKEFVGENPAKKNNVPWADAGDLQDLEERLEIVKNAMKQLA